MAVIEAIASATLSGIFSTALQTVFARSSNTAIASLLGIYLLSIFLPVPSKARLLILHYAILLLTANLLGFYICSAIYHRLICLAISILLP